MYQNEGINEQTKQSLRFFLNGLAPEEHLVIESPREDYLMSAIVEELEKRHEYPVIEIKDPNTGQRSIGNTFANRDILRKVIANVMNAQDKAVEFSDTVKVPDAPVQEEVYAGTQVNLLSMPVYRHFKDDAGRYITSGIVMAKDPDTGRYNFSFHRMMIKGENKIGISLHSRGDLWRYFERSEEMGNDLEVAVVIGTHPAYYLVGATKIPDIYDDYSWAGAYMDEKAEVTSCKTVGLEVPAYAEYILEGKIKTGIREDEGPFGEYTGYSTSRSTRNVLEVSCITKRKDAIYQDLVPGYAWEHLLLSQFTKEIILLNKLKIEIPEVKAINMPKNGCHFHAYVSMKPRMEGQVRQMMMYLFGLDPYLKLIITVSDDVDVYNEEEVMWSLATRMQADRDVFIVPKVLCNRLDPSSQDGMSAKMGIDATKPIGEDALRISLPEDVRIKATGLLDNDNGRQ